MYQIDNPSAASTQPASTAAGVAGYFTDGNLTGGQAPTVVPAEFLNATMLELLNVLEAAGITPDKSEFNQVALSINKIIQSQLGNLQSSVILAVGATTTLTAIETGSLVVFQGGTLNLPLLSTTRVGSSFFILATAAGSVVCSGTDTIQFDGTASHDVSSLAVSGTGFIVTNLGNGSWAYFGGTAAFKYAPEFAASLANPGYSKSPSGLIVQLGTQTLSSSGTGTATFPIAFPNACLGIVPGVQGVSSASNVYVAMAGAPTKTSCPLYGTFNGSPAAVPVTYYAIGW